jgi:hypothetical protein
LIVVFIGLAVLGWALGLYGPRWFRRRFGFVRILVGCGAGLVVLFGLSIAF